MPDDSVLVSIGADTSGFSSSMVASAQSLQGVETAAKSAGEEITRGGAAMEEAKLTAGALTGSVSELTRGFAKLAAESPAVSAALRAAIPVIAIAAAVEIVHEIIDAWSKYQDELRKANLESIGFAVSTATIADSMRVENLRLDDTINKLENHPGKNLLAEALIEVRDKANELGTSLQSALEKAFALTDTGTWTQIKSVMLDNWDEMGHEVAQSKFSDEIKEMLNEIATARLRVSKATVGSVEGKAALADELATYTIIAEKAEAASNLAVNDKQRGALINLAIDARNAAAAIEEMNKFASEKPAEAQLQQTKNLDDFWAKYSAGFAKSQTELATHAAFWKKFWADQAVEVAKLEKQKEKVEEEGQAHLAEQMDRAADRMTAQNIQNARADADAVEQVMKKADADRAAAGEGQTGPFAALAKSQASAQEMGVIKQEMASLSTTMQRLKADMADIEKQPFISEADQQNLKQYAQELQRLQSMLDGLGLKYATLSKQIQTASQSMQLAADKAFDTFNQGFITMIEGGQTFGRTMQKVWTEMATTVISASLRIIEQMIVNAALQKSIASATRLSDAEAAARHTYASASAIPYVGWIIAPVAAAAAFAAVLAFEKGGLIPGASGQAVPMIGHAGEMVLPQHISHFVQMAAANSSGGNSGRSINVTYAPHLSAIDTKGMADMLRKNGEAFTDFFAGEMRKRNAA